MIPILIHQSDLSAWARCPAEFGYKRSGLQGKTNSAAAFGSVMHHCLHGFERAIASGTPRADATQQALETFVWYWNPNNIEAITERVPNDGWLPRQGYAELRSRGIDALRKYADLIQFDDHERLGLEYSFIVPLHGTWDDELGEPHMLGGSVDRLAVRHYARNPTVCIDDWKTGKEQYRLRHNVQFTAYCYASTLPEFWTGNLGEDGFGPDRGMELYERFKDAPRRGTWINMRTFKMMDAGHRGPQDYERLRLAVTQVAMSVQADIFPLTITGDACTFCDFRQSCGGTGVPDDDHGDPQAPDPRSKLASMFEGSSSEGDGVPLLV